MQGRRGGIPRSVLPFQSSQNSHGSRLTRRATNLRCFVVGFGGRQGRDRRGRLLGISVGCYGGMVEQFPAMPQVLFPMTVGHEAVVADLHEARRQDVQQEATDELRRLHGHRALPIAMRVVFPREGDLAVLERQKSSIGDRHAVGITGQVLQHRPRAAEGPFRLDHPVVPDRLIQEAFHRLRIGQGGQSTIDFGRSSNGRKTST